MPIGILPPDIVEKIAAGEVLERPSSLVKELVENSIDAGATEIEVEFENGGRRVSVSDNGGGIPAPELPLALLRHATSKLKTAEDLWALSQYGFRGEALASISAVSHLTLLSRPAAAKTASRIRSDFGTVSDVESSGGAVGTTVVVEDLFENIPARLKFMKKKFSFFSMS